MFNRRKFLQFTSLSSLSLLFKYTPAQPPRKNNSIVISTWAPNVAANAVAWKILASNGRALDAVEAGVMVAEADPADMSVGYGGLPDRDGKVTLDACIMDENANCGAVMCLEGIKHAIKVARLVMEKTPHVQLSGEGAKRFALKQGFVHENLLTEPAKKAWEQWLQQSKYDPMLTPDLLKQKGQINNHDTIGMLALDNQGNLSGACSTSGMAFKMPGRIGDSPIIGSGLYVDNEVGAATATGVGEEVVRICGSHTVVEMMRQGYAPEAACKKAIERIIKIKGDAARQLQVGFIALDNAGTFGAYAIQKGFTYAVHSKNRIEVFDAPVYYF